MDRCGGVAVDRRSGWERIGRKIGSGVTRGRGCGCCGGARVLGWGFRIFLGFNFSGFEEQRRGRVRGSRPAIGSGRDWSGRVSYRRTFGGGDLHRVGGFGS